MENLFLTVKEHETLKKHKKRLEKRYDVKILMPKVDKSSLQTDIIFATICGRKQDIKTVKNFLSRTLQTSTMAAESNSSQANKIVVITLSDSEEDTTSDTDALQFKIDTSCQLAELTDEKSLPAKSDLNNSVCIIDTHLSNSIIIEDTDHKGKRKKVRQTISLDDSEICEVTSTTDESNSKKRHLSKESENDESKESLPGFLPLHTKFDFHKNSSEKSKKRKLCSTNSSKDCDDIVILKDIEKPLPVPRSLRPIVIDGSNVAREHGKFTNTFSSKGIQIAVEYFVKRGHTNVTAFIPKFRKHRTNGSCPTTDKEILEDLEKKNHLAFTPSRRVNGKCINSYDDRFIVDLASQTGGVIVSNDNFKDLVNEDDAFKKAVEERLLMYCFVGDIFMVPKDPLGRNGPSLDDYLSYPQNEDNTADSS